MLVCVWIFPPLGTNSEQVGKWMPPTKSWDSLQTMNEGLKVLKKSTTKSASAGSFVDFLTTRSWIRSRSRYLMLQDGCTLSARSHTHVCVQYTSQRHKTRVQRVWSQKERGVLFVQWVAYKSPMKNYSMQCAPRKEKAVQIVHDGTIAVQVPNGSKK